MRTLSSMAWLTSLATTAPQRAARSEVSWPLHRRCSGEGEEEEEKEE